MNMNRLEKTITFEEVKHRLENKNQKTIQNKTYLKDIQYMVLKKN